MDEVYMYPSEIKVECQSLWENLEAHLVFAAARIDNPRKS